MWQLQTWEVTKLVHSSLTEQYVAKMLYNSCVWSDGFHKGSFLVCSTERSRWSVWILYWALSSLHELPACRRSRDRSVPHKHLCRSGVTENPGASPHSTDSWEWLAVYNGKSVACVMVVTMFPAVARHSHAPILGVALLASSFIAQLSAHSYLVINIPTVIMIDCFWIIYKYYVLNNESFPLCCPYAVHSGK